MIAQALALTLRLAVTVSLLLLVIGIPLAYWLAFSRKRWKFFVEAVVSLPIVLPPTVLGFYVLVAIGPLSPVGRWYQSVTGHALAFTFQGLVVGSVLYSLPFAVQPMKRPSPPSITNSWMPLLYWALRGGAHSGESWCRWDRRVY